MTEVEKLLTDKEVVFYSKGKDLLVQCFNPEHDDDNPSLRIDRMDGKFHCFGCGYKGNVFTRFNRYRNIFNSRIQGIKDTMSELRKASWTGYETPTDAFFMYENYRGIPADVMKQFRAFKTDNIGMEGRVVFPITDNRETIVGFQGRLFNSDATPKYMAYPAEVSLPWYPSANKIKPLNNSIILVEGLLDALYLHGKGITNAVTIFGTKSVKYDNVLDHLTQYLLMGVDTIYLMMDGDTAGHKASEFISHIIKQQTDLIVKEIHIGDDLDPATLSDEYLENLRNDLTGGIY